MEALKRPMILQRYQYLFYGFIILSAIIYVVLEWVNTGAVTDVIFVGLLLSATIMLIKGVITLNQYAKTHSLPFFVNVYGGKGRAMASKFIQDVFNEKYMVLLGLGYGLAVPIGVLVMGVWSESFVMSIAIFQYLFIANFFTGYSFYGLIIFIKKEFQLVKVCKVSIFNKDNDTTLLIKKLNDKVVIIGAVYIGLSLTSIIFSKIPLGVLTIAYSLFAMVLLLYILMIPTMTWRKKMKQEKEKLLREIDGKIEEEVYQITKNMDKQMLEERIKVIDNLNKVRMNIEKKGVWASVFGVVRNIISVVLLTALPIFMQIGLKHFMGG